ncbi:MAG: hypothetical protein B0W54_19500 [Cellvibrio sp. 79]|nr:MAG: hypothetical protein B0W54_19500 [Cellvibrio sp. 79]
MQKKSFLCSSSFTLSPINRAIQLALLGMVLPAIAINAQEQPVREKGKLQKVVISDTEEKESSFTAKQSSTGTKTDTPTIESPQSISVVTAERVEAIGATRLKEALAYTPGVNTAPWGSSHYDWIYLRGFDAYSPGFLRDGLPLRNSMGWGTWMTESYGVERFDVMRGPASVLYGQAAAGGVVNVVSKRPSPIAQREVQVQVGDHDWKQVAGDLTGSLAEDNSVSYRLVGLARDAELPTTERRDDELFLAPSLAWDISANTNITFLGEYLRIRNGTEADSLPVRGTLIDNPNGPISPRTFKGEPDHNRYYQDQWTIGYELEHEASDRWTFRQNTRYAEFDTDYRTVYGTAFRTVDAANPASAANFRLINRTPHHTDEEATSFTIDNQLQGDFQSGNWSQTLLVGVDYQQAKFDVFSRYGGVLAPLDLYNPVYGNPITLAAPHIDEELELTQTGIYAQDQIKFNDRWVVTLGGRYDEVEIREKQDAFSGRAGLVYLAPNGLAPYISYSESFQPITTINPATGKPFDPEEGKQEEAGLRYQPNQSSNIYSIAVFEAQRMNYVTYGYETGVPVPKARGEVTVRGVELEAVAKPTETSNLIVAYTWIPKADITSSANPVEVGKQLQAVSEHQLSVWGDYAFTNGFKTGLGLRYVGSNKGTLEAAPREVPAYTLADLMLGYEFDHWDFRVNVRNAGDKEFATVCDARQCFYGAPRSVIGTVEYHW